MTDNSPIGGTGPIIGFIVSGDKFSRAVTEPISVHPANDFVFTAPDKFVVAPNFNG